MVGHMLSEVFKSISCGVLGWRLDGGLGLLRTVSGLLLALLQLWSHLLCQCLLKGYGPCRI